MSVRLFVCLRVCLLVCLFVCLCVSLQRVCNYIYIPIIYIKLYIYSDLYWDWTHTKCETYCTVLCSPYIKVLMLAFSQRENAQFVFRFSLSFCCWSRPHFHAFYRISSTPRFHWRKFHVIVLNLDIIQLNKSKLYLNIWYNRAIKQTPFQRFK